MIWGGKLGDIAPENEASWKDRLFFTIDIDWAHDEVLSDTIDLVDQAGVHATWFVTHDTPVLNRLRANRRYELGIHPNFNWLLRGNTRQCADAREVIARVQAIVPDARCLRSHSIVQSSGLLQNFSDTGFTHDVNKFIPASAGIPLKPWRLWNGMVRVPYNREDVVTCLYQEKAMAAPEVAETLRMGGLHVFDFHPIHTFFNTETMQRYERTRDLHHSPKELQMQRNPGKGARTWLMELLYSMDEVPPSPAVPRELS
jgi:hypothetical protein